MDDGIDEQFPPKVSSQDLLTGKEPRKRGGRALTLKPKTVYSRSKNLLRKRNDQQLLNVQDQLEEEIFGKSAIDNTIVPPIKSSPTKVKKSGLPRRKKKATDSPSTFPEVTTSRPLLKLVLNQAKTVLSTMAEDHFPVLPRKEPTLVRLWMSNESLAAAANSTDDAQAIIKTTDMSSPPTTPSPTKIKSTPPTSEINTVNSTDGNLMGKTNRAIRRKRKNDQAGLQRLSGERVPKRKRKTVAGRVPDEVVAVPKKRRAGKPSARTTQAFNNTDQGLNASPSKRLGLGSGMSSPVRTEAIQGNGRTEKSPLKAAISPIRIKTIALEELIHADPEVSRKPRRKPKGRSKQEKKRVYKASKKKLGSRKATLKQASTEPITSLKNSPIGTKKTAPDVLNDDFCSACKSTGYFICCETCSNSFHLACIFPPLSRVPDETWYCVECKINQGLFNNDAELEEAMAQLKRPIESYKACWDAICALAIKKNPTCFVLPKKLRLKQDAVLELQPNDEPNVVDSKMINTSKLSEKLEKGDTKPKGKASSIAGSRVTEIGHCHCCGLRAINPSVSPLRAEPLAPKPLIRCDGCPLLWHLDCLDPPLSSVPSVERKWLCPAHVNIPIHPNYIPDVELEVSHPQAYSITPIIPFPPPPNRIILPEATIRLDFVASLRKKRADDHSTVEVPLEVQEAYEALLSLSRLDLCSSIEYDDSRFQDTGVDTDDFVVKDKK